MALDLTLSEDKRNISLVDNIIRLMLDDKDVGVKGLVTFNVGDFQDVCLKNRVEILAYEGILFLFVKIIPFVCLKI